MKITKSTQSLIATGLCLYIFLFCGICTADDALSAWDCVDLLDATTKEKLISFEKFYYELFGTEEADGKASEEEINLWIQQLNGSNTDEITKAAACLGIVKAKGSYEALQTFIKSKKAAGRAVWIATRSLGQIGNKESIPILTELLEHHNANTRIYAMAGLVQITGVPYQAREEKPRRSTSGGKTQIEPSISDRNQKAIVNLRRAIDEKYSYRDMRGLDWEKIYNKYEPRLKLSKTTQQFGEYTAKMLAHAKDLHVRVKVNGKSLTVYKRKARRNYNTNIIGQVVPNLKEMSKYVYMGRFDDNIGYILITSWARTKPEQIAAPALKALKELSDTSALIIDVRPNGGGAEPLAQEFAGCFIEKPVVYAKHINRSTRTESGWTGVVSRKLKVNSKQPRYKGKVVVLMGNVNMSSCEAFLLMMKQVPGCKLIGCKSYGSSGNPKPFDLGNGVVVDLPSWKVLRLDETCFEGEGIEPDIKIATSEKVLRTKDRVLYFALKYLTKKVRVPSKDIPTQTKDH